MEVVPYSPVVHQVIQQVLKGATLRKALEGMGITPDVFAGILQKDKEAGRAYALAQEVRGDLLAEEVIEIADGDDPPDKARNRINTRQWYAGKINKRYSDRIDVNVTQSLDVSSVLAEIHARRRPVRDQLTEQDSQVLDVEAKEVARATDKQSAPLVAPADSMRPDIFS
jgi:hypothetical protein